MDWTGQTSLTTEVLVIGSGAGGSVVAAQLAQAGFEVLIVEKGGDESPREVGGYELEGNAALFERRGGLTTADLGLVVLAGSTLGGGTVVNWSTSLPTPKRVRHQWAHEYGFEGVDGADYEQSTALVQEVLNVNTQESQANPQNQVLARGGKAAGFDVKVIPRNVKGCVDCSYCGFGCRYGAKQSARQTFLAQAQRHGAKILVRAQAERVIMKAGRASGALLSVSVDGQSHPVSVKAKAVVVAAGAIHSPALLLRSGLNHPQVGRNLRLHPVTAPVGVFDEPIRSWQGPPQTRVIDDMADMDGRGYGVRFEVAPAHPGLWASALQWTSGRGHKELMAQVDHLANIIVLTRDQGSGRVVLGSEGQPVLHYLLNKHDRTHLKRGVEAVLRIMKAAGAHTIMSPHTEPHIYRRSDRKEFERYIKEVQKIPVGPNRWGLFSAHQMGTCRISGTRNRGVVRPDGRTWEVEGLFVADASIFPTASGVNPMVSIMASAHLLSQRIISQLN
jgi:choline dehydrogenase-like flavoprotein